MRTLLWGILLAVTLPPFPLGWLAPLPLALILRAWQGPRPGWAGFWSGLGFWGVHLIWLPQSFTALFGAWGWVPFVPLVLLEALLWAGLARLLGPRSAPALVGGWVLLEAARGWGTFAFPWGYVGYALTDAPGRVLAALGGVWLLSLVVLLTAWGLERRRWWVLVPWAALWALPLPAPEPSQTALLVQGALNPLDKALGRVDEARYRELTLQGLAAHPGADLVVWPETAVRGVPRDLPLAGRGLIAGVAVYEDGYRNRVVWLEDGAVRGRYDKNRLVPFGEFFPWRGVLGPVYAFFFQRFGLGNLADTVPGRVLEPLGPYGAYVCYESAFPGVARALVRGGARVLVNVSNDAWFGPSFGGAQHFAMGRIRAVETGRWLLRAGNDGITAAIDPYGRVVARLEPGTAGYLAAPYAFTSGTTPYVRFGDWALGVAGALLVWGWARGAARRREALSR